MPKLTLIDILKNKNKFKDFGVFRELENFIEKLTSEPIRAFLIEKLRVIEQQIAGLVGEIIELKELKNEKT